MRITRIGTSHLQPRLLVVRVHTDAGLTQPFRVHEGYLDVPQGPGLGIELDDGKVAGQRFHDRGEAPPWTHADGGGAEW